MSQEQSTTREIYHKAMNQAKENPNAAAVINVVVRPLEHHVMEAKFRDGMFTILSDEPSRRGGEDKAPSMMEYFLGGLAMTHLAQFIWNAADLGITLKKIELSLSGSFELAGWVGLQKSKGMKQVTYDVKIESDASHEKIKELSERAFARCPATTSIMNPVPVLGKIILNGNEITKLGY